MMKRAFLYLSFCGALWCANLSDVKTVYLLPMSHGLDQFLANRLTNEHVFQVVTDPKLADAVITDQVGANLQSQLETLLAEPPKDDAKSDKKDGDKDAKGQTMIDAASKLAKPQSSMSRARGTIFLVDTKSRQVVWSAYELPKDFGSKEMDRTASDIVSRIMKDLGQPKKK